MIETALDTLRHLRVNDHAIGDFNDLLEYARQQIAKKKVVGYLVDIHDDYDERGAFVDAGRWIINCECGAGNAAHPDWDGMAVCTECGSVHHNVVFPDLAMRRQIEVLLDERPDNRNKFWFAHESIEQLRQENVEHLKKDKKR